MDSMDTATETGFCRRLSAPFTYPITLNNLSKFIRLRIHLDKSKVVRVGAHHIGRVKIKEYFLEELESICYLGSIIIKEGGTAAETKPRV